MNRKISRIILLLIVIAGAALALFQRFKIHRMSRISIRTAGVLPSLQDADAGEIILSWRNVVSSLKKTNGKWILTERPGVPVNQQKVSSFLHDLKRLRAFKVITPADPETMKRVRVIPSDESPEGIPGVRLQLKDTKGKLLLDLVMGRGHFVKLPDQQVMNQERSPDGRYYAVRKPEGKTVFLSSSSLESYHPAPGSWIQPPNPRMLQRTQSIAYREIPRIQPLWMIYRRSPADQFMPYGTIQAVRVDPQAVRTLFSMLNSQFVTDAYPDGQIKNAESPFAALEIVSMEGLKQILTFRKIKDDSERVLLSIRADASKMKKGKDFDPVKFEKQLNAGVENICFEIPEKLFNMLKTPPFEAIRKNKK